VFAAQRRYVDLGACRAGEATQKIATAVTRAAYQGLTPVPAAVSANAKRLGRKRLKTF
jgi:hypothetical protein